MKSGENWSSFSEKKTFKDYEIFKHVAQRQGQITLGDKILIVTKRKFATLQGFIGYSLKKI